MQVTGGSGESKMLKNIKLVTEAKAETAQQNYLMRSIDRSAYLQFYLLN